MEEWKDPISISTHSLTRRLTSVFDRKHTALHISTHSLTRRLTALDISVLIDEEISTHSLTRRLTRGRPLYATNNQHFNSQPHKEADSCKVHHEREREISTHSLTRRLTVTREILEEMEEYFNSQPHKEADHLFRCLDQVIARFQLTASQGGWLKQFIEAGGEIAFQLTASQGGWHPQPELYGLRVVISTHSLTRRLTLPKQRRSAVN